MKRYHAQNLSYDKLPMWRHGRAWLGRWHAEWSVFREPLGLRSLSLFRWGVSVYIPFFGLHVERGNRYEAERGAWEVSWRDGGLHFESPWVRQMEWRSADPWWRKSITLPVVDLLIGRSRCETVEGEPHEVFVPMPEGSYRAMAKSQAYIFRRRWYWPERRHDSVWLDIPGGIPCSGKGEDSWDCGDDGLYGCGGVTVEGAIAYAVESSLRDRRRQGYDSKGTERTPAAVLNAEPRP